MSNCIVEFFNSIAPLINFLSMVAITIAAFATFNTVSEMRKSRLQAMMPRIVPVIDAPNYRASLTLYDSKKNFDFDISEMTKTGELIGQQKAIFFKNIGQAPAINIKIKMEIKGKNINQLKFNNWLEEKFLKIDGSSSSWQLSLDGLTLNAIDICEDSFSYCISSFEKDFSTVFELPGTFMLAYVLRLLEYMGDDQRNGGQAPAVHIDISYSDLLGTPYQQQFLLEAKTSCLVDIGKFERAVFYFIVVKLF